MWYLTTSQKQMHRGKRLRKIRRLYTWGIRKKNILNLWLSVMKKAFYKFDERLKIIKEWRGVGKGKAEHTGFYCSTLYSNCFSVGIKNNRTKHQKPNLYTQYQIKHHIFHKLNAALESSQWGNFPLVLPLQPLSNLLLSSRGTYSLWSRALHSLFYYAAMTH